MCKKALPLLPLSIWENKVWFTQTYQWYQVLIYNVCMPILCSLATLYSAVLVLSIEIPSLAKKNIDGCSLGAC